MWLEDASVDDIKSFFSQTSIQLIISKPEGTILWANDAFCTWIRYTNYELQHLSWLFISVQDADLDADKQQLRRLTKENNYYAVQKRYIPKNSKPELGTLTVIGFYKGDLLDYCINVWEPFKNGTAAAFDLAITNSSNMTKAISELSHSVSILVEQKEEEKLLLSLYKMSVKYPKLTTSIIVIVIGLAGFDNIISTLQRLGFIPSPTVNIQEKK